MRMATMLSTGLWLTAQCLAFTVPARAVPGQTLPAFRQWVAGHVVLRGIAQTTDELSGRPKFGLLTADHGIAWRFDARTDGRIVQAESLAVGEGVRPPGSTPIAHDGVGYGFTFFRSLYGPSIASDFRTSHFETAIADSNSHVVTAFYRGKRFGYEVAAGIVTIAMLKTMDRDRALLARCSKHPGDCAE